MWQMPREKQTGGIGAEIPALGSSLDDNPFHSTQTYKVEASLNSCKARPQRLRNTGFQLLPTLASIGDCAISVVFHQAFETRIEMA